jgi:hypothetical protein
MNPADYRSHPLSFGPSMRPPAKLLLIIYLLGARALAAPTLEDFQPWNALMAQGSFSPLGQEFGNWRWWFEGQARFLADTDKFGQGIIRPGLGYALTPNASVWLGYAWLPTQPVGKAAFDEHRIWQQFSWSLPTDWGTLSTRGRLEQRFTDTGKQTGWRFRQLVKFVHPLPFEPRLSLVAFDELFVNLNDTDWNARDGFDQNRAFAGLGWNFDTAGHYRTELGYLNQYIRVERAADRMNHVLSATLFVNY